MPSFSPTSPTMRRGFELWSGGVRSGKSRLALDVALAVEGTRRLFLATAEAFDQEMHDRIELHRQERQDRMQTLELSFPLQANFAEQTYNVILVDCLSLWISRLLFLDKSDAEIEEEILADLQFLQQRTELLLLVSNEVGFGIVPDNALARRFRDINGRLQQRLGSLADELYLVFCGQALPFKRLTKLLAGA